ncbi:phosphoserine phosphatase SerB [Candidatus Marsarchaeota G2 archaeon ECH_B_SAG-G16]|jgi:phosphoserine phosphatase|uniref:phosphoserine phosphatase n=4 Tax=Candidatus Marsarchaeota TaxID=1978152 RepID=A0A2R6AF32_9ARCH|nr:MAG: phosphoserine phosphatase SerB [Candidatus Marsarchaeota G1 archaeon OSP_D]PSN84986.1 MAG: phosphoserine phosphatase SerB [Candidatus Marsarchaeota G1 archaeon BE_D]PSN87515.1 MAG: phosphoserine phosphatase SerB [Candidatus Marsarchaeota G1 archaeon OSP_C]PSO04674.1 MAG: phosphoserine phosphatase SerB [Candidatus Marsarchaeota G2 archaeon ECH_B_SAG-G16]
MIVAFDVEGVLVDGEFLPEVAKLVGKEEIVRQITLQGIRGEINWEEGLRRRVEELKGVDETLCVQVAQSLPFMPGAKQALEELRQMGCTLVGVSGGFSLLGQRVKKELKLDHIFTNELVFHKGRLIGYALLVNANKTLILKSAFGELLEKEPVVAVVDGANDLELFTIADLKIAFNAQEIVKRKADVVIEKKDLTLVSKIIREWIGKSA